MQQRSVGRTQEVSRLQRTRKDPALLNHLNSFYVRFKDNTDTSGTVQESVGEDRPLSVSEHDDGIPGISGPLCSPCSLTSHF